MYLARNKMKYLWIYLLLNCFAAARPISAAFLDWLWVQNKNVDAFKNSEGPFITVPFEYKTEDEKFLEEASKFTDLMKTSSLDVCQHKVILQIKTSCFSMTEEELAKMSVNLLNCQSQVDERKIFPCTESMSLKECTKDMDSNMWNAYHLMNNRARAVCLAARRTQFQALSEMTVNKLMATAHDQINKMSHLLEGQEKLENLTLGTLDSVERGHVELLEQQEKLKAAQKTVQDFVTFNLEQLTTEKALIAAGNKELAKMTQAIKEKLDEANEQLSSQSEERTVNHQKLLKDIEALQNQARGIFKRIDSSTEKLLQQHEMASLRYKDAVENLVKINDTVHYLLRILNSTRQEINNKFFWLENYIGGTGSHLERVISVTFHIVYLLVGMLFASFLNASTTSRALLALLVPLNLFVSYHEGIEYALDFFELTTLILFLIITIALLHALYNLYTSRKSNKRNLANESKTQLPSSASAGHRDRVEKPQKNILNAPIKYFLRFFNNFSYNLNQLLSLIFNWTGRKSVEPIRRGVRRSEDNFIGSSSGERNESNFTPYTRLPDRYQQSVNSRVNEWLHTRVDYPRSETPSSTMSGTPKYYCSAVCRTGRRCKNVTSPGRDVCHKHLSGTSVIS